MLKKRIPNTSKYSIIAYSRKKRGGRGSNHSATVHLKLKFLPLKLVELDCEWIGVELV
jgi:hypothetical protein